MELPDNQELPIDDDNIRSGVPLFAESIPAAGFDLLQMLVPNPPATFLLRVSGNSMINAGIFADDILIVDRSLSPKSGDIVVAVIDGEFNVRRVVVNGKKIELRAANPKYKSIKFAEKSELNVWGVVKSVVHFV
ncbi:MAG: S24 family peptidase [Planctomycetaceae bacterium]|jgi:DNA polymerase V|nr:S24 family peptidase [Planctomycetaceae bacterium]